MPRLMKVLVAVAVIALVSPLPGAAAAIHVLVDHDHEQAPDLDPEARVHGHAHSSGTPAHEHGILAPAAVPRDARASAAPALAVHAFVGPLSTNGKDGACRRPEAIGRASPIERLAPILRI